MSGIKDCERCQRRKVSGNKRWCLSCCEALAAIDKAAEFREELTPMDNCTHVIVVHKEGDIDIEDLYRANGMLCASRQKDVVRFGTDISTAQNRPFLNRDKAHNFLLVMAEVDLKAQEQMLPIHEVIDTYVTIPQNEDGTPSEPKAVIDVQNISEQHSSLVLPVAKRLH